MSFIDRFTKEAFQLRLQELEKFCERNAANEKGVSRLEFGYVGHGMAVHEVMKKADGGFHVKITYRKVTEMEEGNKIFHHKETYMQLDKTGKVQRYAEYGYDSVTGLESIKENETVGRVQHFGYEAEHASVKDRFHVFNHANQSLHGINKTSLAKYEDKVASGREEAAALMTQQVR